MAALASPLAASLLGMLAFVAASLALAVFHARSRGSGVEVRMFAEAVKLREQSPTR